VSALAIPWEVTTMVLITVVVTLGVECDSDEGVVWPFSTSMGVVVSTPTNVWMPPAAPVWLAAGIQV